MNLSGSGVSWSLGPRGASIGIGKRGTYLNTGIPGTGFFAREKLSGGASSSTRSFPNSTPSATTAVTLTVSIDEDGVLTFKDTQGNLVPEWQIDAAKKQQGDKIKALIQDTCDKLNEQVEALGKIHEFTSPPKPHSFEPKPFTEPIPIQPTLKVAGFFCRWFKSCVAKVEAANKRAKDQYTAALQAWNQKKAAHEAANETEKSFLDRLNAGDVETVEQYFGAVLQDIAWPKETLVTFEIPKQGVLVVDVDLPEIEDIPNKTASVPQRGYKLSVKEMGPTQVQKLYMRHVHAIGFRIAGEAFAASPNIEQVVLSTYSQRPDKATGQIGDEYLYSVKITRDEWHSINFENLEQLDVVEALTRFELRRDMTKTGVFKPIQPFDIGDTA
ncbi:DUF4236 domain-containing protein [Sulfuricella denitrificans]